MPKLSQVTAQQPAGLLQAGNIDLHARPIVRNPDGSISTVRSMSANFDGREVLIPTVSDDGRVMSDQEAIQNFQRTGRHLGMFDTTANATAYAESLHNQQADEYLPKAKKFRLSQVTSTEQPDVESGLSLSDLVTGNTGAQFGRGEFDPARDMSTGERLAAAFGGNYARAARGGDQLASAGLAAQGATIAKTLRAIGFGDLADAVDRRVLPLARRYARTQEREAEARRLDAPLKDTTAGTVGNVLGYASQILGPGILARGTSLAPALLPTSIRGAATQGAAFGALEPVVEEGERGRNILVGTAAGGGGQAALRGAGAVAQKAGSLIPSVSRGQQERAAANVIRDFASNPEQVASRAANPQILVEGTQPTLAEATEDAGIVSLQRALRNRQELQAPLAEREAANNLARVRAIQQGFGGADEASAQAIRDAAGREANVAARGLRSVRNATAFDPFANVGGGAAPAQAISLDPVTAGANALINRNANRPVVQQALTYVRDLASRPIRSADEAWNLRKTINDLMDGKVGGDQAAATAARRELITLRGLLDREMTRAYPQWGEFLRSYRGANRAADQVDVGQALLDTGRAVRGATNEPVLTPAAFSRAAGNLDQTVARAVEFRRATADKILEPKQRQLIDAVRRDLERFSRAQGGQLTPGISATVSNAMGLNKVQDAMGPLAATAIEPVSGLALALVNNLRTKFGQEVAGIVNDAILNPQRAAEILARLPPRQRTAIIQQVAPVISNAARQQALESSRSE